MAIILLLHLLPPSLSPRWPTASPYSISDHATAEERMIAVTRFYLSAFHAARGVSLQIMELVAVG